VVLATFDEGVDDVYQTGMPVDLTLHRNGDADPASGTVRALVVYADGLAEDPEVAGGTEAAVEVWRDVWGAYGIELEAEYVPSTIDPALPWPGSGEGPVEAAAALSDGTQVVVIVGDTIDGGIDYLGVSGSVPGTLIPTARSGTVVSWLANAGVDGAFSEEEVRIYGETLAHEVGHYVGLFHPVEEGYDYWDALDDTPECTNAGACAGALGDNLMFPWPVCDGHECLVQDELTDDQQQVMQRYSGTL
jgi:hypothetical protein